MNTETDRIKRVEDFLLDPERALFTTLEEFRAAVNEMLPVIRAIDLNTLATLRGEDGITPQRGKDYMTADDISALEAFILSKMPQTDVDYPSVQATEAFINFQIAKIPRVKGDDGKPGRPGTPGENGSPDTGADILRKLRTLGRNQGLQIDDIRGLENRIKLYNTAVDELAQLREDFDNQRVILPANPGGGSSVPAGSNYVSDAQLVIINNTSGVNTGDQVGDGTTITGAGTPGDPFVAVAAVGSVAWGAITGVLSAQTDLQAALDAKAASLTADQNYVSDAQLAVIANTSGINTGDQDLSAYLLSATAASTYEPIRGADDNYVTDAQLVVIANTSGVNTGDNTNFAPPLGADDNYVTDAEKVKLSNLSGTNTGDQTSIVGITGTIAQFNTAVTDADLATLAGTEVLTNKTLTGATNVLTASLLKSATTEVSVAAATAPVAGQVLTAINSTSASWQTPGGGAFSGVRTYQNAASGQLGATLRLLEFQVEQFDTDTFHDNSTNPSRITFLAAGKYIFGGSLQTNAGVDLLMHIRLNGTTKIISNSVFKDASGIVAGQLTGGSISSIYQFAANDYIEFLAAASGASLSTGDLMTSFWAYKIG